jgi:hypothetical protein
VAVNKQSKIMTMLLGRYLLIIVFLLFLPVACSERGEWTDEQIANARNVARALRLEQETVMMSNRVGPGAISPEDFRLIRDKLRSALEHAVAARDDVLDKIHRDLKPHWKEELIKGLRLRLSYLGSTSGEHQDEVNGDALLDKFRDWLKANTIRVPIPRSR